MNTEARRLASLSPGGEVPGDHLLLADGPPDATRWMEENRHRITGAIAAHGWVLLRGLDFQGAESFKRCVAALGFSLTDDYGDLPMSASEGGVAGVFDVTPFPPEEAILFHHEGSHTPSAPRYICFHCALPAAKGGETPLADSARVFAALPPEMQDVFARQGLLYRRSFIAGFDVPWQRYFATSDPAAVESLCRARGIRAIWRPDGGLTTETHRPAVIRHPDSSRPVFFNQILLHHPACLDPEIREAFDYIHESGDIPRDVRLGDDSEIFDSWVEVILAAQVQTASVFPWQRGDVVIADNLSVAHARMPYQGERRHHVMLSQFQAIGFQEVQP
jgi:alpha-ketoglutarate-dependent taurine dioxygenase